MIMQMLRVGISTGGRVEWNDWKQWEVAGTRVMRGGEVAMGVKGLAEG